MLLRNIYKTFYKKKFYKFPIRYLMDFDPKKDYYKILGVPQEASEKDIKSAYYKLAKKYHPDLNAGKQTNDFKEMTNAYDILSDPKKKQEYDAMRKGGFGSTEDSYYSNLYNNTNKNPGSQYSGFYRDQKDYSNKNYSNTQDFEEKIREQFKRSGFSNFYTKYQYKDPKTGEWKTYTNTQGNPFFKDFEDLFKRRSQQNQNYYYDNNYQNQQEQGQNKEDPFRNYWERNKNYDYRFKKKNDQFHNDDYYDPNRFSNNKTYNPFTENQYYNNPRNFNNFNYDNSSILMFHFLRRAFIFMSLIWLFSLIFRRRVREDFYFNNAYGYPYPEIDQNYAYSQYPPNPHGTYIPGAIPIRPIEDYDPFDPRFKIRTK